MAEPRRVRFNDYARMRMRSRDILEEEVAFALARPSSAHRHRRDGRSEVRAKTGRGQLLVVYIRSKSYLEVINAMWE